MADRDDPSRTPDDLDPDAPPTAEEVAASQRLRDALEKRVAPEDADDDVARELELVASLRAAWDPSTLGDDENDAAIDALPSEDEVVLAAALRDALAAMPSSTVSHEAVFALSLRNAFAPRSIDEAEHRAIVDAALAKMPARLPSARSGDSAREGNVVSLAERRTSVLRIVFGAGATGLALAASIFLIVTTQDSASGLPLAKARTTQPLFSEPFKPGESSARIDRIASARASDFRDNRFAKWGVK